MADKNDKNRDKYTYFQYIRVSTSPCSILRVFGLAENEYTVQNFEKQNSGSKVADKIVTN